MLLHTEEERKVINYFQYTTKPIAINQSSSESPAWSIGEVLLTMPVSATLAHFLLLLSATGPPMVAVLIWADETSVFDKVTTKLYSLAPLNA